MSGNSYSLRIDSLSVLRSSWTSGSTNSISDLDREYVRYEGSQHEKQTYHHLARSSKRSAILQREVLAEKYLGERVSLSEYPTFATIDNQKGVLKTNIQKSPEFKSALKEAQNYIKTRNDLKLPSKGSLDFIASSKKDFHRNSSIVKLALSPILLVPIIRYLGMLPILFSIDISRANKREILDYSSHLYHVDPEDITQMKVFIYINDVDENTGPFTALPANVSADVIQHFNYRRGRLTDEAVYEFTGNGKELSCTGQKGTATFCDTTRCLHFGGRTIDKTRYMLTLMYALPTSTWFPLHSDDGEARILTSRITPKDDEIDMALFGKSLTI